MLLGGDVGGSCFFGNPEPQTRVKSRHCSSLAESAMGFQACEQSPGFSDAAQPWACRESHLHMRLQGKL
jgi:hypothetical protein